MKRLNKAELEKINSVVASLNNAANQVAVLEVNKQAALLQYSKFVDERQRLWNEFAQKYKLDPTKTYNLDQKTGAIVVV